MMANRWGRIFLVGAMTLALTSACDSSSSRTAPRLRAGSSSESGVYTCGQWRTLSASQRIPELRSLYTAAVDARRDFKPGESFVVELDGSSTRQGLAYIDTACDGHPDDALLSLVAFNDFYDGRSLPPGIVRGTGDRPDGPGIAQTS